MKLKNFYTILTIDIMEDMKLVSIQDMLLSPLKTNHKTAIDIIAKRITSVAKPTLDSLTKKEAKALVLFLKKNKRAESRENVLKVREDCRSRDKYDDKAYAEAAFEFMTCEHCIRYLEKKLSKKDSVFPTESTQNLECNTKKDIFSM